MALLEVKGLTRRFGGLVAVNNVDFAVEEGAILGIIGPNGAGKTTLYNLITGVFPPTAGKIMFNGENVTRLSTHRRAAKGLVRTFQATTLFNEMTSLDNVLLAHHLVRETQDLSQFLNTRGFRNEDRTVKESAENILDYLGLSEAKDELAKNLPHGHQRALGIALGLAASPRLLLLDEPVTGMNEAETANMVRLIKGLRDDRRITIVVVEHDMRAIMGLSEHIMALNFGKKIAEGTPAQVVKNKEVIEAYLGMEQGE